MRWVWSLPVLWSTPALFTIWVASGWYFDWSETWYRVADVPIFWAGFFLLLLTQRRQDRVDRWMEDRVVEVEEATVGVRPKKSEECEP